MRRTTEKDDLFRSAEFSFKVVFSHGCQEDGSMADVGFARNDKDKDVREKKWEELSLQKRKPIQECRV